MSDTRITSSFRFSCKENPADRDSAWMGNEVTVETTVSDATPESIESALKYYDELTKAQVFQSLGLEFKYDEAGVIRPMISQPTGNRKSSGGGGKPEVAEFAEGAPRATQGTLVWLDWRKAKETSIVSNKFPDFKTDDGRKSVWLTGKDGTITVEGQQISNLFDTEALTAPM